MDAGKKVGAHTMRHSAAVAWHESGVHIEESADLLGHSSIAITGDLCGHTAEVTARGRARFGPGTRSLHWLGVREERGTEEGSSRTSGKCLCLLLLLSG